jgi:aerotaxis receptor
MQSTSAATKALENQTLQLFNAIRAFRTHPTGRELTAEINLTSSNPQLTMDTRSTKSLASVTSSDDWIDFSAHEK